MNKPTLRERIKYFLGDQYILGDGDIDYVVSLIEEVCKQAIGEENKEDKPLSVNELIVLEEHIRQLSRLQELLK